MGEVTGYLSGADSVKSRVEESVNAPNPDLKTQPTSTVLT